MKYLIGCICVFFFSSVTYGQIVNLLEQYPIHEYQEFERSINSELHLDDFEFGICRIPWKDPNCMKGIVKLNGLIYKRSNDDFLTGMYTWYFTFPNQKARHIKVNWGFYNNSSDLKQKEIIALCEGKEQDFIDKYNNTKAQLIATLGEPTKNEENENNSGRILKKVKWDFKDKYVCLTLVYYKTEGNNFPEYYPINTSVEIDIYFKKDK